MSELPEVILLDLDDTILSYEAVGDRCWEQLCQSYAPRMAVEPDVLLSAVSQARRWYWSDPGRHHQGRLGLHAARREIVRLALERLSLTGCQALGDELAGSFTILREDLVEPFPGALEALHAFRRAGARLGLLTNGSAEFQRRKIERFHLPALFDVILIESEFGVGKPDPRVFRQALSVLDSSPEAAWMVGNDLTYDIQPALSLGLTAVWVDFAKTGLPSASSIVPSRIIHSLVELLN